MSKNAIRSGLLVLCLTAAPFAAAQTTIGTFTGGDPGEGLDLQGNFVYAVNFRGPAAGAAGDAVFTADNAPGVTYSAPNEILNWAAPSFGASTADDNLEVVMESIRWANSPAPVTIDLANLQPGRRYKLQLLFTESCCDRGFNVRAEGQLIAGSFSPALVSGIDDTPTQASVITYTFWANDSTLNLELDGFPTTFPDRNPIISGLTLEDLSIPPVPALDARALALLAALLAAAGFVAIRRA